MEINQATLQESDRNVPNILSEEQIVLVNIERRKIKETPEDFKDWEEVRKQLILGDE
jgi:hypothetical protein